MFKPTDIKWVKNIKRHNGTEWAYFDDGMENEFYLNFSKTQISGGQNVQPGELILLFQRVDNLRGVRKETYLTHLVTPVDFKLKHDPQLLYGFEWFRKVAVVARADPRTAIFTRASNLNFYKPQWGKVCEVKLLRDDEDVHYIQEEVWRLFNPYFNDDIIRYLENEPISDDVLPDDIKAREGAEIRLLKEHFSRERNRIIVGIAKSRALEAGLGNILCECCDFNFRETYGQHGYGFIECHHATPLAKGERITKLNELHMVCSNCHRMLHRKKSDDSYYTVGKLRELLKQRCNI